MSDPTPGAACLRTTGDDLPDSGNLASQPIPIPPHHFNEQQQQQQQQQNQQRLDHGQDNDHEHLVPRSLPSSLPSLAAVLADAGHAHPNDCGSNGDRHAHETDQEQGQHTRSKSQPALGLDQPSSPAPLLHRRTGSGCGGCYSRRTSADATHCTDCSRTGLRRTIANNTKDRSSDDLSSFLDFAISATGLVESLHARGLAHGQLGPGSFQWQPSGCGSGLLTADLALPANNNNNNNNNNSSSNNNRGHPQRRENYTSPGRLSVDRVGSSSSPMIAQNIDNNSSHSSQSNSRAMPIRKQPHTGDSSVPPRRASQPSQERRFSLSLDCTHLGFGDLANTATAPTPAAADTNGVSPSGARGGLRDSQPTMATIPPLTGSDSVVPHSPLDQETSVCTHMGRSNNHTHAASLSSSVGSAKPNCSCCSRSDSADGAGSVASGTGMGAPTTSAAAAAAAATAAAAAATTTTMTTTTTATATATTSMTTTSTTTTTTVLQEGFAARVARFKRSFMPLAVAFASPGGSSPSSQSSLLTPSTAVTAGGPRSPMVHAAGNRSTPNFFTPSQYQHQHQHRQPILPLYHPTAAPFSNGASTVTVSKKHFLLNIPTELYPRPGGPPSIQVDIYSLGVMFYYMMTTHSALLPSPEDGSPMTGAGGAAATPVGSNGITPPIRKDAYLPTTPTRLANIIQKMISIGKDSFATMALVRNELVSVRDQEQEASKKEAELKEFTTNPMDKSVGDFSGLSSNSLSPYSMSLPRATSSSNSIQSTASSSTANTAQGLEQPSEQQESSPITAPIATMRPPFMNVSLSTPSPTLPSISSSSSSTKSTLSSCTDSLSLEDQVFILESVLSLGHIPNLQEMLRAISVALDSILVVHPPEEMAIILWQKDERSTDGGGSWAIIEDKFQPGDNGQSTLIWTDLAERRDQMPVLVKKALDSREPVFSTAVGSRSQLPTIACLPIIATNPTVITGSATVTATNPASLGINQEDNSSSTSLSSSSGTNPTTTATATTTSTATTTTTLVGAIYLHHLHPRFYFSKRDRDMLMLFCQKLANPLLNCDRISILERNVTLATQRSRFLEDTFTRIQKTEHEVLSWMEALPCYVWAAERDDVSSRRYLSGSWFGYTGLPHDSRMSDLWLSKMHPDDVAAFQKEVSQSYKTGVYKDCEFRLMRKDGVYRWHLSRAVPVLNQYGAVIKWIGVTIDIDDLYSAQKAELHKKSNFLANMSHELRTPFSGFHGMLSLLGYSNLDEEQQECVHTAKASCEKLLLIIDDLLDFSKLEADKVTLEASSFDLEEVFDEVEDIVEPLAKQKSLEMAFIKAENVPEVLIGDCNRLKQILLNLVGNAIKFTHSGHVIVKCKVLDRDFDMANLSSEGSMAGEWEDDDDKFYFRHEKNGGGQCRSENRPPNSGRFSSPEPLSETSIKLMFSVEDTGIGINSEEQAVLFSPFSQVDGSATRSYGGSGLGLSICLQLVKLMKGRIGLNSQRGRGSTFWFVVQCEQSSALPEGSIRDISDTDVPEPTKEIKRITRTMGKPRILIASNSETTVKALQTFRTDFNTEIADLPSIAASRLDESVANGLRFDFICWDFPSLDPNHEIMLELNARPDLLNVHFVLLYSNTNTDMIRRAQSLQLPSSSSSSGSSASPSHSVGAKRRPMASQPISLRKENTFNGSSRLHGSNSTGRRSPMFCDPPVSIPPTIGSVVPGLSPEMLSSLRITYISKPIRRLKLLRAFVEILDDSARIHGAQAVKKGSVGSSTSTASSGPSNTVTSTPTVLSPTSPTTSSVSGTSASLTAMASPISSPTTVSASSSSSALHSKNSSTTTVSSPVSLPPMSASMLTTLENALGLESQGFKNSSYDQTLGSNDYNYKHDVLQRPLEDYELGVASGVYKKNSGDDSMADKIETEVFSRDLGSATVTPRQQRPPVDSIDPTEVSGYHDKEAERDNLDQVGYHGQQQVNGGTDTIILTVQDPSPTSVDSSATGTEDRTTSPQTPEQHPQSSLHVKQQLKKAKSQELKVPETRPTPLKSLSRSTTPSPASLGGSNGGLGGLSMNIKSRSNSPKPTKTSKLVTEERSETSLSLEEAERISGMRILLAEDNEIAQKVLSRQLAMFGLVISCANDGTQALELFKAHPRGYYALGFFDHHMPNCDGVQATQQIRVLEREHATAVKGPVPRLPVVAVSADIQETARRACLNSGMERYVTKPLMQKDLVEIVRRYCVEGDAEASTLAYDPPPEGSEDLSQDVGGSVLGVPTTVEAMASGCLVSAPIGGGSAMSTPILLSMNQMPGPGATGTGATGNKSPAPKPAPKRDMGLSPAALRGLALINESNKMDESAKVGGGGDIHQMATTTFPSPPAINSTASGMISPPMQHSMSHQGIITGNSYQDIHHHQHQHHHHQHHYQQHLQSQGGGLNTLHKSSSSSSLYASYHQGLVVTPKPITPTTGSETSTAKSPVQGPSPIAAMAAGAAAAAVAVASAAVNTVSSAINDHIHPPSLYAAQVGGSGACSTWKNILVNSSIGTAPTSNVLDLSVGKGMTESGYRYEQEYIETQKQQLVDILCQEQQQQQQHVFDSYDDDECYCQPPLDDPESFTPTDEEASMMALAHEAKTLVSPMAMLVPEAVGDSAIAPIENWV